jgi:hypothetical protein
MNHIYLRVSTDHQDAENQKTGIWRISRSAASHVMLPPTRQRASHGVSAACWPFSTK